MKIANFFFTDRMFRSIKGTIFKRYGVYATSNGTNKFPSYSSPRYSVYRTIPNSFTVHSLPNRWIYIISGNGRDVTACYESEINAAQQCLKYGLNTFYKINLHTEECVPIAVDKQISNVYFLITRDMPLAYSQIIARHLYINRASQIAYVLKPQNISYETLSQNSYHKIKFVNRLIFFGKDNYDTAVLEAIKLGCFVKEYDMSF